MEAENLVLISVKAMRSIRSHQGWNHLDQWVIDWFQPE